MSDKNEERNPEKEYYSLKNLANDKNRAKMRVCGNSGCHGCIRPFCDYCYKFNKAKTIRELVDEWRSMAESTERYAKERGDFEKEKFTTKRVVETFTEFLQKLSASLNAYGDIREQDEKKNRGEL